MNKSPQESALSREAVSALLAQYDESCRQDKIGYYPSIRELSAQVRSSKCWAQGEVFVYAESDKKFIVMMQIARASCEMLTISNCGFQDVLTAHRFELDELEATLNGYMTAQAAQVDH